MNAKDAAAITDTLEWLCGWPSSFDEDGRPLTNEECDRRDEAVRQAEDLRLKDGNDDNGNDGHGARKDAQR